ncbi:MAG: acyltransferase [Bacteroidota bacterium]
MFEFLYNKFRRITTNQLYLPEVDGMRFLSLSLVTLFHIRGYFLEKTAIKFADNVNDHYWMNKLFVNFDRSVPLFFAISGFILCTPFAHHYINGGKKINLKQYYVRRLTRLEPPYFIVMICIFIAQLAMRTNTFDALFPSLGASLIYAHDIIYHTTPLVTVVAWTLEIEVQYYIMAPLLFRLLALPAVTRRAIICAAIAGFITLQFLYPPKFLSIYGSIQHFLIGILIGDLYVSGWAMDFFKKKWVALIGWASLATIFLMPRWEDSLRIDRLPLAIALPFLIGLLYYVILRNASIKKVFSYGFIPVIGGMCYTTYLIHYTVISMLGRYTVNLQFTNYYYPNLLLQFVVLCSAILFIASFFYLYIERPFMSKKWVDKIMGKDKHKSEANMHAEVQGVEKK